MPVRLRQKVQKLLRTIKGGTVTENYQIIKHIENFKSRHEGLYEKIRPDELLASVKADEALMSNPDFYNDMRQAEAVSKRVKDARSNLEIYNKIREDIEELRFYFDYHKTEQSVIAEIENLINAIEDELNDFEIKILLSNEYDSFNAILELRPGAGGTESQDWTEMLFRMYSRYAEKKGYRLEVNDYQDGEEAGIKNVMFSVYGDKAYGYLKSEHGVHRLVRISPFDSNARRHTSFCSCTVTPIIGKELSVDIKPEDIRVDTFRASGHGGQGVNTTDSAVRITHIKTGLVASCQNERSQIQNRENAMMILKSKLYQLEVEEHEKKLRELSGKPLLNRFGGQIRSYVFHPYSLIKDLRTNYEVANVAPVMDGDIGDFINAYLRSPYNER